MGFAPIYLEIIKYTLFKFLAWFEFIFIVIITKLGCICSFDIQFANIYDFFTKALLKPQFLFNAKTYILIPFFS